MQPQRPEMRSLYYLALFLIVVGARLWLISLYGTPVPILDQWDGEGAFLFKPWLEGTWHIGDFFQPHNEHRIVLARLMALALLLLNGQWDSQLEMAMNALICGVIAVLIAVALVKFFSPRYRTLLILSVGLWSALPYGHENTLWAFQSSFYFLLFFSLLAIWGMAVHCLFSLRWWFGFSGLILASLSMGSGFFSALVLLGLSVLGLFKKRVLTRDNVILITLCLAVVVIAYYFRVTVPHHAAIKATSLQIWANAFGRCLAWPFCDVPALALVMYAPSVLLVVRFLTKGKAAIGAESLGPQEVVIGASVWVVLQAAAIAYSRGGGSILLPVSRYMDLLAFGGLANLLAILFLVGELPPGTRVHQIGLILGGCWIAALAMGSGVITHRELALRASRTGSLYPVEESVRAYVATGDHKYLEEGDPPPTIPYPNAARLAALLDDPTIRNILPAVIRAPLPVEKASETGNAFVPHGSAPSVKWPVYERGWGSYSPWEGVAARGTMRSRSMSQHLHYLQFEITGYLRKGLSLIVEGERTGKKARVIPTNWEDEYWRLAYVVVPDKEIHLIAEDDNREDWFGFREPREMARFSYYADVLTRRGKYICYTGMALLLASTLLQLVKLRKGANDNNCD
jgi:hypothetical protein